MHIAWDDARFFLAVSDAGSMSAAARALKVAQPTVSRRLAVLEANLGEPLFTRNVDGVALTSFGERLVAPARAMAEWAAELERAADRGETTPRGVVRITAPPGISFDFLAPFARTVRARLPDVTLEVISTVSYLDLGRREADLALRMQPPAQRELVCLAILPHDVVAFATREYLRGLPRGYGVADVDWIAWAPPLDHLPPNPQLAKAVPGFRPAFASDDFLVQLRAAASSVGAIFLGRVRHRFSDESSPLVELALDIGRVASTVHLIAARSALEIPRVRAVADLLTREVEAAAVASKPRRRK